MSTLSISTNELWWKHLRSRLTLAYLLFALILMGLSVQGHVRLLSEVGKVFGGFFWAVDTDGQVVLVSTPSQLPSFRVSANSLSNSTRIVSANGRQGSQELAQTYQNAHPGDIITYVVENAAGMHETITRPAVLFTWNMWWQNYGLAFVAGMSWLIVGFLLLISAAEWTGAVEGITLLPPAMLLLLYSHWGNIQQAYPADVVFQLLWVPSFALLGAAFIHLSLTYRPETLHTHRRPRMAIDMLPYLPLLALFIYEWGSYIILQQHVPTRPNLIISLGYGVIGGIISFCIGINSLLRVSGLFTRQGQLPIPVATRRRIGDLLALWIGGVGLGVCFGVLPILLTGQTLFPLPMFYILASMYPFILWYAIRTLRLIDRLHVTLDQREAALQEQRRTEAELRKVNEEMQVVNKELQQATSLLLHADTHLRSLLSQRIHDQPKQQALRMRSLLNRWQRKLRQEAEQDPSGKVVAQPIIEALGTIRTISEEQEKDLRGLQLLVEDVYRRRSLGLRLHLEQLIQEDLPSLHPESSLKIHNDLDVLDKLDSGLEQTEEGEKIAEAISYGVTQALLNVYNHAEASDVMVNATHKEGILEVSIIDNGRGFDPRTVSPEKTSLFKAQLKAREVRGNVGLRSIPLPQNGHGTTVFLRIPVQLAEHVSKDTPVLESRSSLTTS